jgi:hypothetical protein
MSALGKVRDGWSLDGFHITKPILQPWARKELCRQNALIRERGFSRGASCGPLGVPALLLHVIHPVFFI